MRRLLAALTAVVAFAATPALAVDVAGFYAGFYVGGAQRNATDFGLAQSSAFLDDLGVVKTPDSFVNDGIDPLLFDFLNAAVKQTPFADFGGGGAVTTHGSLSFTPAMLSGLVFGYTIGNGVRLEADLSQTSFGANVFTPKTGEIETASGSIDADGVWTWTKGGHATLPGPPPDPRTLAFFDLKLKTDVQFLLLNAFYDIGTGTAITPYVGGGIGVARVSSTLTDTLTCTCGAGPHSETASTIVPAAQIGGGVRIAVAKPVTLDIGYRYRLAASPNLKVLDVQDLGFGSFGYFATKQSGIIGIHTVTAGLTFALN